MLLNGKAAIALTTPMLCLCWFYDEIYDDSIYFQAKYSCISHMTTLSSITTADSTNNR